MATLESIVQVFGKLLKENNVDFALIGGMAVIAHGHIRTTKDADFCFYSKILYSQEGEFNKDFLEKLQNTLPDGYKVSFVSGSRFKDDPFQHDVIFVKSTDDVSSKIDLIVARYKWELEGLKCAEKMEGIEVPVLTKPYLIAMKLKASGLQDIADISFLLPLMTEAEVLLAKQLAKRIGRDKKLESIIEEQAKDRLDTEIQANELLEH